VVDPFSKCVLIPKACSQKEHQDALAQINPEYDRRPLRDDQTRSRYPFKPDFQPLLAYLGLIGCLVLVFILNTATWWTAGGNFKLIVTAYGGVSANLKLYLTSIYTYRGHFS